MKKKEWIILAVIALLSVIALSVMKLMPKNSAERDPSLMPEEEAKGIWVAVVHRNKAILYFDSGINAEYQVTGNVSDMTIEVADGRWRVREVQCYDFTCKNMGWVNEEAILPIICLPNDIVIVDADTAANMISEVSNGN
jgi:hypothetical protein